MRTPPPPPPPPLNSAVEHALGDPPPLLYSVERASRATDIGRSKLYELMASGELESVKCGKRRLIPADALERFVASLRGQPAA